MWRRRRRLRRRLGRFWAPPEPSACNNKATVAVNLRLIPGHGAVLFQISLVASARLVTTLADEALVHLVDARLQRVVAVSCAVTRTIQFVLFCFQFSARRRIEPIRTQSVCGLRLEHGVELGANAAQRFAQAGAAVAPAGAAVAAQRKGHGQTEKVDHQQQPDG